MKILFTLGTVLTLILTACAPRASSIFMTADVSTAMVGTVVAVTLPPADYTLPPYPIPLPSTIIPSLPGGLSPTELKYRLLDVYPDFFYCDPDLYPIALADETQLALQRFPELQENMEEFQTILAHNGLNGLTIFTDQQKLLIYQQHKKLNALNLELTGDLYKFQLQISQDGGQGHLLTGTIDAQGNIKLKTKEQTIASCPICLAFGTRIDTPHGPVPVQDLRAGDLIWTLDPSGARIPAHLVETGHVLVPPTHRMIHMVLEDGRQLWASPGHHVADGRRLMELQVGAQLDGSTILSVEYVAYSEGATYDILPSGGTGFYWANGILLASTMATQP